MECLGQSPRQAGKGCLQGERLRRNPYQAERAELRATSHVIPALDRARAMAHHGHADAETRGELLGRLSAEETVEDRLQARLDLDPARAAAERTKRERTMEACQGHGLGFRERPRASRTHQGEPLDDPRRKHALREQLVVETDRRKMANDEVGPIPVIVGDERAPGPGDEQPSRPQDLLRGEIDRVATSIAGRDLDDERTALGLCGRHGAHLPEGYRSSRAGSTRALPSFPASVSPPRRDAPPPPNIGPLRPYRTGTAPELFASGTPMLTFATTPCAPPSDPPPSKWEAAMPSSIRPPRPVTAPELFVPSAPTLPFTASPDAPPSTPPPPNPEANAPSSLLPSPSPFTETTPELFASNTAALPFTTPANPRPLSSLVASRYAPSPSRPPPSPYTPTGTEPELFVSGASSLPFAEPSDRTSPVPAPVHPSLLASGALPSRFAAPRPQLSLNAYASLYAELTGVADGSAAILARYGLTAESRKDEDTAWRTMFEANPALRIEWMRDIIAAGARLRRGR